MKICQSLAGLCLVALLSACGGGGGDSSSTSTGPSTQIPPPSETPVVLGGTPSAPTSVGLSSDNVVNNNPFNNYFKYAAVAGERLIVRVNLSIPLSDTQFARCASNPGTGATPSSYASQIHVYSQGNARVGGICGEDLRYTFAETGVHIFIFDFPSNDSGFFNAASIKGDTPVRFLEIGNGSPIEPKKLSTITSNLINANVFFNYYWFSAAKGETIVVNSTLAVPLSAQQKTRCAANPDSHNSQIYVYDAKLQQVGLACGESMRFVVPVSGNYVIQPNFGATAGVFHVNVLK